MDLKYSRKTKALQSLRYRREKRDLKYSRKTNALQSLRYRRVKRNLNHSRKKRKSPQSLQFFSELAFRYHY